jgi:hypothetical protein
MTSAEAPAPVTLATVRLHGKGVNITAFFDTNPAGPVDLCRDSLCNVIENKILSGR